jgi:hypothetical protein
MPTRVLFGVGAIGDIVKEMQQALLSSTDLKSADRIYGQDTATAVKQFQTEKSLPATGSVDEVTWQALMNAPLPSAGNRSLQLTAAFEGHGFELAVGNFDGALLTWGIIGFTLTSGEVQSIINTIDHEHPELIQKAFGTNANELLQLISSTLAFQKQWADEHTLKNRALTEPWRSMFATFGSFPEVQAEQIKHVRENYLRPAITTAGKLGFSSELGLALCFDIHVQNGGIKAATMKSLLQQFQTVKAETARRKLVANTVADSARVAWRDDVRRRKMTVATGEGKVHGHSYQLSNWGLSSDFPAAELTSPNQSAA